MCNGPPCCVLPLERSPKFGPSCDGCSKPSREIDKSKTVVKKRRHVRSIRNFSEPAQEKSIEGLPQTCWIRNQSNVELCLTNKHSFVDHKHLNLYYWCMLTNIVLSTFFLSLAFAKPIAPNFSPEETGCLIFTTLSDKQVITTYGDNCKVRTAPCSTFKITLAEVGFKNEKLNPMEKVSSGMELRENEKSSIRTRIF